MDLHTWRLKTIDICCDKESAKTRQFGVLPLGSLAAEQPTDTTHALRQLGIWAVQHFVPIQEALATNSSYNVLVGFRPSRFHLGHVTLARELSWHLSRGASPIFVVAGHEAGVRLPVEMARQKVLEFWTLLKLYSNVDLPMPDLIVSDTDDLDLRLLEDRVSKVVPLQKIQQLYGWSTDNSMATFRVPAILASSFLYAETRNSHPTLVLADIKQVTHIEITKIAARALKMNVPGVTFRLSLPSLIDNSFRMSVRVPKSAVFLDEDPDTVEHKLLRSVTGGRPTSEEQRSQGGNPVGCSFFHVAELLLSAKVSQELLSNCASGAASCRQCKLSSVPLMVSRLSSLRT